VYADYRRSNFRVRQVDEKDLIEAAFTYEFWRQRADIVSRCFGRKTFPATLYADKQNSFR